MRYIEILKQLVAFPSVSSESNLDVSRCVEAQLKALGFVTEWLTYSDPNGVTKVCVSGRIGPLQGRGYAYFCHTDVVPVESWSFADGGPWEPLERNNRIYGRGSCDMKGSLACALAAVENMDAGQLTEPYYIVCTADEEIGLKGAEQLVSRSEFYRDIVDRQCRAIIGEPTSLEVVHAHKGGRGIRVTAHGIAAHSSTGKGINANFAMIPFLHGIQKLVAEIDGDANWEDERFSPPTITLNITLDDNNCSVNMTAAQSTCAIYFRAMPAIDADGLADRIRELAADAGLDFEMMFSTKPLFTDPNGPFIQELLLVTGETASKSVAYGTDGSCFHELRDLAVLGPGDIRQAHTDDEWVSIAQLEAGTKLYTQLIQRWCTPNDADAQGL